MKKIFLVCAAATFLAACNSDSKSGMETTKEIVPDSSQYKNTVNTDTAKTAPVPLAVPLPAQTEVRKEVSKAKTTKTKATKPSTPATTTQSPASTTTVPTATEDTQNSTSSTTPAVVPEKKGMSNSAKGAIIGAGAGAVGGAIISKKKGKGAIIGGIL